MEFIPDFTPISPKKRNARKVSSVNLSETYKNVTKIEHIPSVSVTSGIWYSSIDMDNVNNKDKIRSLLGQINISDSMSIINFGSDVEKGSRTIVDDMLKLNLSIDGKLSEYLKNISDKIKSTYQKRGFFDTLFGFDDRPSLKDVLNYVDQQEKKIESHIPVVDSYIKKLENLYEISKSKVALVDDYCVVLNMAATFYEQNRGSLDDISSSNVPLLSKRYSSFVELKSTLGTDPLVIHTSRLMYLNVIAQYKTSLNSLIHEWKNQINLELAKKNNNFKESGKKIVQQIESME